MLTKWQTPTSSVQFHTSRSVPFSVLGLLVACPILFSVIDCYFFTELTIASPELCERLIPEHVKLSTPEC